MARAGPRGLGATRRASGRALEGDGAVALAEAFRLLDVETVAGVILRTVVAGDYDEGDPRHWHFPPFADLLPSLREAVWQEALAGKLSVEAIKGVRGKRHRAVLPAELPRLSPDWPLSRLTRDGSDEYVEVRVRHLPAVAPTKWRKPPSPEAIKSALRAILTADPTLAGEKLEEALCARLGEGMTRERARSAIKRWAQQTIRPPGRPRKK